MTTRKLRQTAPPTTNSGRKPGPLPRKASAIKGPTIMPTLIAVRERPKASARRCATVRSAIMALLPVRNMAQPKAASIETTTTTSASVWERPSPT
jgi:hypothetical protein